MNVIPAVTKFLEQPWDWFKLRPKWQKVALFVFVVFIIVFISLFDFFRQVSDPLYMVKRTKEKAEKALKKDFERIKKRDKILTKKIEENQAKREKLVKKREKIIAEKKNVHKKIDDADDFDGVDDALDGRR